MIVASFGWGSNCSVNAFEFVLLDLRVVLGQFLLLMSKVVEGAFVNLGMAVFWAKYVPTLARCLHETHLFGALPAFVQVGLNIIWLGLTDRLKLIRKSELLGIRTQSDVTATSRHRVCHPAQTLEKLLLRRAFARSLTCTLGSSFFSSTCTAVTTTAGSGLFTSAYAGSAGRSNLESVYYFWAEPLGVDRRACCLKQVEQRKLVSCLP